MTTMYSEEARQGFSREFDASAGGRKIALRVMSQVDELFATQTMAELSARQGRVADAIAIYRRLIGGTPSDEQRGRWQARLEALLAATPGVPVAGDGAAVAAAPAIAVPPPVPAHRLPLVIRQPVRSGQVVYAENNDLIVLAAVNPGAELLADGNIHVYAPLRGRAVAGAHGCVDARIFCQRLEAELVGIDAAYVPSADLPVERVGRPAQIYLREGRCVIAAL